MTLDDLARDRPFARPPTVPAWTLGAFRRRCISYATGEEDSDTQVIWLQSNGLTADVRVPRDRPPLAGRQSLAECTREELIEIAKAEGFVARTAFADGRMSWDAFAAFQPYDKWPEPGILGRVGSCLIEWAPSGVYVEDWRAQRGASGLSVGLELVSEIGPDGKEEPRSGGLVIAGDHALMVLGRRSDVPAGRAHELIAAAEDWRATADALFDSSVAYAKRTDGAFRIALSVDPFAKGRSLFDPNVFELGEAEGELFQHAAAGDPFIIRRWKIDTLLADEDRPRTTPAKPEGEAWLAAERGTLLGR